jgi:F0F1-type ATP synthase membrane subunit b/b'
MLLPIMIIVFIFLVVKFILNPIGKWFDEFNEEIDREEAKVEKDLFSHSDDWGIH